MKTQASRPNRRSFTLTELMVAVAVLIVVIIATSKIFGTASQVTGTGAATMAMLQEAATIEQQFRDDIAKLTNEGFLAIRNVAVRNDVRGPAGALLNPNLPSTAFLRCDQLVFFANGVDSPQSFRLGQYTSRKGQGAASRIYWGHAFQLPLGPPADADDVTEAFDPIAGPNVLTPWYPGSGGNPMVTMSATDFMSISNSSGSDGLEIHGFSGSPAIDGTQPRATQWLLARQHVLLVDDDTNATNSNSKTVYLDDISTARSIFWNANNAFPWGFSREIRNGRLDAAASELHEIRRFVQYGNLNPPANAAQNPWTVQRNRMLAALYWPRGERQAPSMHRVDQALTNHIISSGCSSFTIEWTYAKNTGYVDAINPGYQVTTEYEQPWFGLTNATRRVFPFGNFPLLTVNPPLVAAAIESTSTPATNVEIYEAAFGYNQSIPFDPATDAPWASGSTSAYTPFPTALRVTMTLHDPEGKLEGGREFQFVVDLPKRVKGVSDL